MLFTFLTVWLTLYPVALFFSCLQWTWSKCWPIVESQTWKRFLYSLTAVSIIQTSPVASWIHKHFLTSHGRHTAARQSNLVIDWLLGARDQDRRNLSTFFLTILTRILLDLISLRTAEADSGWGGNLNSHLITSCVKNKYAKNHKSDNHASSYFQ